MDVKTPGVLAGTLGGDGYARRQPPSNNGCASQAQVGPTLHPYQVDAIARMEAAGKRRILCCAPTGSGKTIIAGAIARAGVELGQSVLFLCHRRELVKQATRKLFETGIDAGIIAAGFPPRPDRPVQVASIQTLHRAGDADGQNRAAACRSHHRR